MKKMFLIFIMVHCFSNMVYATVFNQGDSVSLSFSSLTYIGIDNNTYIDITRITFPPQTVIFRSDGTSEHIPFLTQGNSFQINLFENQDDLIPSYVELIDGANGTPASIGFLRPISPELDGTTTYGNLLWEDLEGKLTLTMLSGSMDLDSLDIEVHTDGQIWGQSLEVLYPASVPEPTTILLLGTGIACMVGTRIRRKKHQVAKTKKALIS